MRRSYSHRREVFFQALALDGRQGAAAPSQEHSPAQGGLAGRRCAGHEAPATPAGPGSGAYGQVLSSVGPVGHAAPGRPPRYWSPACRNAGHRQRIREAKRSGRLMVLLISSQIGTTSYRAVSFVPFRSRIRSSPDASGADSTPAPGLTWLLPGVQCRLEYLFRPLPETDGVVFSGVRVVGDRSPYERIGAARLLHSLAAGPRVSWRLRREQSAPVPHGASPGHGQRSPTFASSKMPGSKHGVGTGHCAYRTAMRRLQRPVMAPFHEQEKPRRRAGPARQPRSRYRRRSPTGSGQYAAGARR